MVAECPADLAGPIRIAIRSGVTAARIRATVELVRPDLGARADLFNGVHRAEAEGHLRPRPTTGLHDYATLCRALRSRVNERELDIGDAIGMAATVARNAGIDFDTAARITLAHVVRPPQSSVVDVETRLELAARIFTSRWDHQ